MYSMLLVFKMLLVFIFMMKRFVLYLVFKNFFFWEANFYILVTKKLEVLMLQGLFFGKKLGTSRHIMRGKILKSPHLDNRFQHVTKIYEEESLPLSRLHPLKLFTLLWYLVILAHYGDYSTKTTYIFMK